MGNAYLYLGIFCLCTGFLTPLGLMFIGLYVYNDYTSKYKTPVERVVEEPKYNMDEYSSEIKDNYI